MINISDLQVLSFDLDYLDLFWKIENTSDRLSRYDIFVLKSEDGPEGPWTSLAGPLPGNQTEFRDVDVKPEHNWRTYFYRLRVVDKDTSQEVQTESFSQDAPPDVIAIELRRRFEFIMAEHAGRKVLVFPAITSGFRCPSCYDLNPHGFSTGREGTQNCITCYDSTFVGGFRSPILAHIQIDPAPSSIQRSDTFTTDRQDTTARISAYPPLKPGDMLVEAENIRWEVQDVAHTRKGRSVVHQTPTLHRIPTGDIRYKVPVNLDVMTQFSAEREFTRPMCLPDETGPRLPGFD